MQPSLQATAAALRKRGYRVFLSPDRGDVLKIIREHILGADLSGLSIGFGHSETLEALGLYEALCEKAASVYRHNPPHSNADDDRRALLSDIYFLSANAVSQDGYIVNIDGSGNRTAASCFGPRDVVFVVGRNKIAPDLDAAMDRALNYASIELYKKYIALNRELPCLAEGKCVECFLPGCPCGVMTVHRKQLFGNRTTVILVDEDLGI